MKILAIETSCDETSIAIIEKIDDVNSQYKILAHETISQVNKHIEFGGVFPSLAKREHEKNLMPILIRCLEKANLLSEENTQNDISNEDKAFFDDLLNRYPDLETSFWNFCNNYNLENLKKSINAIAVTNGPGLPPALWVGVNFAKSLSKILGDISIYPVNHMEGHIISAISNNENETVTIRSLEYPALALLISGGHTEFVLSKKAHEYEKIGETVDDAVGECFDKVARMLELPYPGGLEIGKLAQKGRDKKIAYNFKFPRPMLHSDDLNFSFSGLKTSILYYIRDLNATLSEEIKIQIATEFEYAVRDVLFLKAKKAIEQTGAKSFVVGGGVISSSFLRDELSKLEEETGSKVYLSSKAMATDNALMIALVAATQIENNKEPSMDFLAVGSKNYNW